MKLILVILISLIANPVFSAVNFNGDADCIETDIQINTNNDWSAAGWGTLVDATPASSNHFFGVHAANRFYIGVSGSANYFFGYGDTFKDSTSASGISDNTWFHWALVGDSGTARYYLNGSQVDSFTYTGIGANVNDVSIAARNGGGASACEQYQTGQASDIAIWDVKLEVSDVVQLASSRVKGMPLQIQQANLQAYWPLDDFSDGSNLDTSAGGYKDRSGNGENGTGVDADTDSTNIAEEILSYP